MRSDTRARQANAFWAFAIVVVAPPSSAVPPHRNGDATVRAPLHVQHSHRGDFRQRMRSGHLQPLPRERHDISRHHLPERMHDHDLLGSREGDRVHAPGPCVLHPDERSTASSCATATAQSRASATGRRGATAPAPPTCAAPDSLVSEGRRAGTEAPEKVLTRTWSCSSLPSSRSPPIRYRIPTMDWAREVGAERRPMRPTDCNGLDGCVRVLSRRPGPS
jgi:hypothetical protein